MTLVFRSIVVVCSIVLVAGGTLRLLAPDRAIPPRLFRGISRWQAFGLVLAGVSRFVPDVADAATVLMLAGMGLFLVPLIRAGRVGEDSRPAG